MKTGDLVTLRHADTSGGMGMGSLNTQFLSDQGYQGQPVPVTKVNDHGDPRQVQLPSGYLLDIDQRDVN